MMFYYDERLSKELYQERLQEAAQEHLANAVLRAKRQAAKAERPSSRLPRLVRVFGRKAATAAHA